MIWMHSERVKKMRYNIDAKRRNTDEDWTAWNTATNFHKAERHAQYAVDVGYESRIVAEDGIKELWEILDQKIDAVDMADAIYDAGFRKREVVLKRFVKDILRTLNDVEFVDEAEKTEFIKKLKSLVTRSMQYD